MFGDAIGAGVHSGARGAAGRAVADAEASGGQPVPDRLLARFAASDLDVRGVRLHTGESSQRAAQSVSARAYTVGQDVHFGAGEYAPGTAEGDRLIAHELAHTLQQGTATGAPELGAAISQPGDALEHEADQTADAVLSGSGTAPALTASGPQRKLMRWANASSALAVQRVIDGARPADLHAILLALGDAEGGGDGLVPLDIPGYAGYVDVADVHALLQRVGGRLAVAPPTQATEALEEEPPSSLASTYRGAGSLVGARDSQLRITEYVRPARELSDRVMADVASGRITPAEGAQIALSGRSAAREATRDVISSRGRAVSELVEPEGRTLAQLAEHYSMRILSESPELRAQFNITTLARGDAATERALIAIRESDDVSRAIISASGRTNGWMTGAAQGMRVVAPLVVGAQIGVGAYRVVTAEEGEHLWTAGTEVTSFAGGTLGSVAGGVVVETLAAFALGLGVTVAAPVALGLTLVIVGGGALLGSGAAEDIWNRTIDHHALHQAEVDMARAIRSFSRASTGDRIASAMGSATSLGAGGGFGGLMDRDRERVDAERHRPEPAPETSGGEAP